MLFEGHMDTVEVSNSEEWQYPPFGAEITDGCIYGRGSADMKGAIAAMIHGLGDLVQKEIPWDVYFTAVVFEEIFEGVCLGSILDEVKPDWVILGEPGSLKICTGQKGRAEVVLETYGRNAHSAMPEKGENAISSMRLLLDRVDQIPLKESNQLGRGVQVVTDILSSPYPGSSVVPDRCRATIDLRLLEIDNRQDVLAAYQKHIDGLKGDHSGFDGAVYFASDKKKSYTGRIISSTRYYPGWSLDKSHPLVKTAVTVYRSLGREPELATYSFCTDGSESAGSRGIPTIGIGPAESEMAHVTDEHVRIDDLVQAAQIYCALGASDPEQFCG